MKVFRGTDPWTGAPTLNVEAEMVEHRYLNQVFFVEKDANNPTRQAEIKTEIAKIQAEISAHYELTGQKAQDERDYREFQRLKAKFEPETVPKVEWPDILTKLWKR